LVVFRGRGGGRPGFIAGRALANRSRSTPAGAIGSRGAGRVARGSMRRAGLSAPRAYALAHVFALAFRSDRHGIFRVNAVAGSVKAQAKTVSRRFPLPPRAPSP